MRRETRSIPVRGIILMMVLLFALPLLPVTAGAEYNADTPELLSTRDLNCTACILIEMDSGKTVFEKNADLTMYPASTTKIMTTLCALENIDVENTTAYVSPGALIQLPSDSSRLGEIQADRMQEGEQFNLLQLMYGTILHSANDGANVIAETVSGNIPAFVALMNATANRLGCTNTHFANAHGYHDDDHYTTARDMAIIARAAMQNTTFAKIAGTTVYTMSKTNLHSSRKIRLQNNFFLVETADREDCYFQGANGIKTGYTGQAGYCYVGSATRNGITFISVVFGCTTRAESFRDTVKLMNYGYTQYTDTSIEEIYLSNPKVISISGFDTEDELLGNLTLKIRPLSNTSAGRIVTTRSELDKLTANLHNDTVTEFTRKFSAPIAQGEVMGTLSYYPYPGANPAVYELVASRDIARRKDLAPTVDQIYARVYDEDTSPFPKPTLQLVTIYILLPVLVIFTVFSLLFRVGKKLRKRPRRIVIKPKERYFT